MATIFSVCRSLMWISAWPCSRYRLIRTRQRWRCVLPSRCPAQPSAAGGQSRWHSGASSAWQPARPLTQAQIAGGSGWPPSSSRGRPPQHQCRAASPRRWVLCHTRWGSRAGRALSIIRSRGATTACSASSATSTTTTAGTAVEGARARAAASARPGRSAVRRTWTSRLRYHGWLSSTQASGATAPEELAGRHGYRRHGYPVHPVSCTIHRFTALSQFQEVRVRGTFGPRFLQCLATGPPGPRNHGWSGIIVFVNCTGHAGCGYGASKDAGEWEAGR
mmetsp:Transcript_45184/g.96493  ORF Transcript_45184/g.96493 Transcript_45184/m.96493 type:complete len:277 (+) Transcript_45184:228-1058(+)